MPKVEPGPDPLHHPRVAPLRQIRRIMRWLALFAIVIAGTAVLLVARGESGTHVHMLIAMALGAGLSVLIAGALMSLAFISAGSGRNLEGSRYEEDQRS